MDVTAIIHNTIAGFGGLFTICRKRFFRRKVIRAGRRFAMATGNIDHKIRLAQSGYPAPQYAHDLLATR